MKKVRYLCIDLKSFYASVECVERGLDPFTTNLVVADPSRGKGAICLAVSPRLKSLGVRNRCRLFEIPKNIPYITALPRMKKYIEYSSLIYSIYLKYIAPVDILVYSIDECFLDVTNYLNNYNISETILAKLIIEDVYKTTGICATAGIGTNLFLTKVALDITAKHSPNHIGYLDEEKFKKEIWYHEPITDIWNIGPGIAKRLAKYNAFNLHDVAMMKEETLYNEFGVNAEFLINHARGIEPSTITEIHNYKTKNNSLSNSQILFHDYNFVDALLVAKEMIDNLILELVEKKKITNRIYLGVGYSKDVHPPTGGGMKLLRYTSSREEIMEKMIAIYKATTLKEFKIRRISIGFGNVIDDTFQEFTIFDDIDKLKGEKDLQHTIIDIKNKFGKNAILKGMNLEKEATQRIRNKLIGGHASGE